MHKLIEDTLLYIAEEYGPGEQLLVSGALCSYFSGPQVKREEKRLPPPVAMQEKPPVVRVEAPAEPPKPLVPPPAPRHELRSLVARLAPHWKLRDSPPDDSLAREIATAWKEKLKGAEVALLSFDERELSFYTDLAKAIHTRLKKASVVDAGRLETEKRWGAFFRANSLTLLLCPSQAIGKYPQLTGYYLQKPSTAETFLNNTPALLLSAASVYQQDVASKRALWNTLCTRLSS